MVSSRRIVWSGVLGLSLAAAPCWGWVIVPPRAGQVGIGVQGQYGTMLERGSLGGDYESGSGISVRLRYRMRFERGFGLSFESQSFKSRGKFEPEGPGLPVPERLKLFTAGPELYQMFGTRTKTHKMLSLGVGLAHVAVKLEDGQTSFPTAGDGIYISAGAGIERFIWQSWAYDLSTRYMSVFHDGQANHDFQASLGLIFYASY